MALSANIQYVGPTKQGGMVQPCSLSSKWMTVIDAGGPAVQDAATIQNPDVSITAATRHIFYRGSYGTNLLVRLGYDDGLTIITDPIIKIFGRTGTDAWQILPNKAASPTVTLATSLSTDAADGTLFYTAIDMQEHQIDCQGCEQILIGVETALAGTGSVANSIIQIKLI